MVWRNTQCLRRLIWVCQFRNNDDNNMNDVNAVMRLRADLESLQGSQVGAKVSREHSGKGLDICHADFLENFRAVLAQEGDEVLLLQEHVLLQYLYVCFGFPQLVYPGQTRIA